MIDGGSAGPHDPTILIPESHEFMTESHGTPDPDSILDLLQAFRRSQTLFAAVSLGVFDALSHGPRPLAEIAAELGAMLPPWSVCSTLVSG